MKVRGGWAGSSSYEHCCNNIYLKQSTVGQQWQWGAEERRKVLPSSFSLSHFFLIRCLSDKVGQHYTSAQPAGVEEGEDLRDRWGRWERGKRECRKEDRDAASRQR